MRAKVRVGIMLGATFGLGLVGAAMLTGVFTESKVCADAMGAYGTTIGDRFADETAEGAVTNFVELGIMAPELLNDEQAIVIDEGTLVATLYEDGVMVAWFDLEETASGGYTIGLEAYCTDGDDGPFLAKSFDPRSRLGIEVEASESG